MKPSGMRSKRAQLSAPKNYVRWKYNCELSQDVIDQLLLASARPVGNSMRNLWHRTEDRVRERISDSIHTDTGDGI
jgi:hypothetical protein